MLYDNGGCAYRAYVIDQVYERMKDVLTDADKAEIPGTSKVVFDQYMDNMRQRLVQRGLLRSDSERGVWELTPKGEAEAVRLRNA